MVSSHMLDLVASSPSLFYKRELIIKSTSRAFMRSEMRCKQLLARSWQEARPGDRAVVMTPVSCACPPPLTEQSCPF